MQSLSSILKEYDLQTSLFIFSLPLISGLLIWIIKLYLQNIFIKEKYTVRKNIFKKKEKSYFKIYYCALYLISFFDDDISQFVIPKIMENKDFDLNKLKDKDLPQMFKNIKVNEEQKKIILYSVLVLKMSIWDTLFLKNRSFIFGKIPCPNKIQRLLTKFIINIEHSSYSDSMQRKNIILLRKIVLELRNDLFKKN